MFFSIQNIKKSFFMAFFAQKKKTYEKKGRCFDKNHELTSLQNVVFFRLSENFIFEVQKTLCSFQNIKKCFLWLFLLKKKHMRKRSIFWQKPCTNPLQNVDFFYFARISLFGSKKLSLLSRIKKMFLSGFFG